MTPNAGCERGMDQCKVNYAFDRMRLNWTTTSGSVKEFDLDTEWAATGDVNVIIFSLRVICRLASFEQQIPDNSTNDFPHLLTLYHSSVFFSNGLVFFHSLCRQRFCMEEVLQDYYIWHKGSCDKTAEAKKESVEVGGLWWLREDWKDIPREYKGEEWLRFMSTTEEKIDF